MDLSLSSKRAAVAASTAGLGFGAAQSLVREGCRVAICGRSDARVAAAVERLGPLATGLVCDVSTGAGGVEFVERATAALGGIDILVTNAGGPAASTFATTELDQYPAALELNLLSVIGMCKAAVPGMQAQDWGRVVAITSVFVRQPSAHVILSNVSRTGATAFLSTLAREVAADGVTVNSLQPGIHATDRIAQLYGADADPASFGIPTGTIGSAADFGEIVAFLCSEQARFITGAHIPVDGGAHAGLQ